MYNKNGKLIVIEGTDCSGKQTQSELLLKRLNENGIKTSEYSFPNYDSPTGRIIGGPYLGKPEISKGWFSEGAVNVNAKVASLYYAADRLYNIDKINEKLKNGEHVILDRYVYSNMAYQAGKLENENDRKSMYNWLEKLEFDLLELPKPDIKIFLHMPIEFVKVLKNNRQSFDEHELQDRYLEVAEKVYMELCDIYDIYKIECVKDDKIKSIQDINDEVYEYVVKNIINN